MAIFHLSAQIISRKDGRSSTAAAAYRAGERIVDTRTGEVHDYTRRRGVVDAEIVMPTGSIWAPNRAELWNSVESKNKRADSQVAREFVVALPSELGAGQRCKLAIAFARLIADRYGVAADVAMHAPSSVGDDRNHHAHILTSTNKVDGFGFGNKARELDLVAHNMSGKMGQANEIEWMREQWAEMVNAALEECAAAARVDHRSYERQALAVGHDVRLVNLSTVHLGPKASSMERRGVATMPGDLNREVEVFNLELERVRRQEKADATRRVVPVPAPAPASVALSVPAPSPVVPESTLETIIRRDRLGHDLQALLQLDARPRSAEATSAIKRWREQLQAVVEKRIREDERVLFGELELRSAAENFQELRQQHAVLQNKGRSLLERADRLNRHALAVGKWTKKHPTKALFFQWGVMKSDRMRTATSKERESHLADFRRAGSENERLLERLAAVRKAQATAEQLLSRVRAEVDSEVRRSFAEVFTRLDQAALLAAELQCIEEAGPRMQRQELSPIPRLPSVDRGGDDPYRRSGS